VLAKLEYFSPSGSVKDRIAHRMIEAAERRGELRPGGTIVEATTGNTGIAFACAAAVKGYRMVVVMPEGMSEERKQIIRAYGAELQFVPGSETGVDLAVQRAHGLAAADPNVWIAGQFENEDNTAAHEATTAPEIWEQTGGRVDCFVDGIGSGGTITGVARGLRARKPDLRIVGVEPAECAILTGGAFGPHRIEGIGDGFVPEILDFDALDEVVVVPDAEAIATAKRLAREEGIFCGISSGANVWACLDLAGRLPTGSSIVTMINDSGQRYFSTDLCR